MHNTPDTGDVVFLFGVFLRFRNRSAEEAFDFADYGFATFAGLAAEGGGFGGREELVFVVEEVSLYNSLLREFRGGLVGLGGHDEDLSEEDKDRDDEVGEEKGVEGETAGWFLLSRAEDRAEKGCVFIGVWERNRGGSLVEDAVDEEDDGGSIESASEQREDKPRAARKGVRKVERRNKDERAAESNQEVRNRVRCFKPPSAQSTPSHQHTEHSRSINLICLANPNPVNPKANNQLPITPATRGPH